MTCKPAFDRDSLRSETGMVDARPRQRRAGEDPIRNSQLGAWFPRHHRDGHSYKWARRAISRAQRTACGGKSVCWTADRAEWLTTTETRLVLCFVDAVPLGRGVVELPFQVSNSVDN